MTGMRVIIDLILPMEPTMIPEKLSYMRLKEAQENHESLSAFIDQILSSSKLFTKSNIASYGKDNELESELLGKFREDHPNEDIEFIIGGERNNVFRFFTPELKVFNVMKTASGKLFTAKDVSGDSVELFLRMINRLIIEEAEKSEDYIIAKDLREREHKQAVTYQHRASSPPALTGDFDKDLSIVMNWSTCFREFYELIDGNVLNTSNRDLHRIGRATLSLSCDPIGSKDEFITIHRAMPAGSEIEVGDWVSTSHSYAEGHLTNTKGLSFVDSIEVPQSEVYLATDGNEYIYIPDGTWGDFESLEDLWQADQPNKPMEFPKLQARAYDEIMAEKNSALDCSR